MANKKRKPQKQKQTTQARRERGARQVERVRERLEELLSSEVAEASIGQLEAAAASAVAAGYPELLTDLVRWACAGS